MIERKKKVLILSATASAINYINSFGHRKDVELHVTDASPFASGLYSKGVIPHLIARSRNQDQYQKDLERIIETEGIEYLIPTSDHDMEGVMGLIDQGWEQDVRMFQPDPKAYWLCSDKHKLISFLQGKRDIGVPKLFENENSLEFPCVIKPTREGGSKGVWILNSPKEFENKRKEMIQAFGQDFTIQEYIPGGRGSIFVVVLLFNHRGELVNSAVTHSTLTYMTWGGGGNAGKMVDEPEMIQMGERIMDEIGGWKGPVNLEFKKDMKTGEPKLMEVNCRLNGYSYLLTMNGLDFPDAILRLLSGEMKGIKKRSSMSRNFILGFREKVVDDWVGLKK